MWPTYIYFSERNQQLIIWLPLTLLIVGDCKELYFGSPQYINDHFFSRLWMVELISILSWQCYTIIFDFIILFGVLRLQSFFFKVSQRHITFIDGLPEKVYTEHDGLSSCVFHHMIYLDNFYETVITFCKVTKFF